MSCSSEEFSVNAEKRNDESNFYSYQLERSTVDSSIHLVSDETNNIKVEAQNMNDSLGTSVKNGSSLKKNDKSQSKMPKVSVTVLKKSYLRRKTKIR